VAKRLAAALRLMVECPAIPWHRGLVHRFLETDHMRGIHFT
jgi:hypothetical protein